MTLAELQSVIAATYGARDAERGIPSTVAWIAEEVGELAQAWVASLANQLDIDLTHALERYAAGCPKCHAVPCACG